MATEFNDMTNAELKEACEDFGLEVKAKNPGKPNKSELLAALEEFKAKQDAVHADKIADKEESEAKHIDDGSKRKPQTKAQLLKLDLFRKERVLVHDQQDTQTKDEMISVSWGNRSTGGQTDWIDLTGEPQYIRVGALNNLKEARIVIQEPKDGGGVHTVWKNRFIVTPVEALTEDELKELARKQTLRTAKYA